MLYCSDVFVVLMSNSRVSRIRVAIIVCWLAAAVYNLPRFFERSTTTQTSMMTNSSSSVIVSRTALRENTFYIIIYKTALFLVARFLLPFSSLAYFNTRLILAKRRRFPR